MRFVLRTEWKYWRRRAVAFTVFVIITVAVVIAPTSGRASHLRDTPVAPSRSGGVNPIVAENGKIGTNAWQIARPAFRLLEGYASVSSVSPGGRVTLYVTSSFPTFSVDVYRMGWYGGAGARSVWTRLDVRGTRQAAPTVDPVTRMVTADWTPSLTIAVGRNWTTGVYLARLQTPDGRASFVPFTVREGAHRAPFVFQSSVTTWQAYNDWGGHSLYTGGQGPYTGNPLQEGLSPKLRSTIVSFDRPYSTGAGAGDFLAMELPILTWLEHQGYDIGYATNVDLHEDATLLTGRRALLSMGHDEYWSTAMRDHVEQAISSGVNLAFFGANALFRHIRFERSDLGADRHEVNYRSTADPITKIDPAESTVQWRAPPVNRPEDAVLGAMYECNPVHRDAVVYDPVPWLFHGTRLTTGDHVRGLVGREYDRVFDDSTHPTRIWVLFRSPLTCLGLRSVADSTFTRFPSGAGVFDASTQGFVCAFGGCPGAPADQRVQRLVHNLLDAYLGRLASPDSSPRPFTIGPRLVRPAPPASGAPTRSPAPQPR